MDNLLTLNELCEYLKLGKQTIYNFVNQKKIPYIKVVGSLRFKQSEIEKWIEESRVKIGKGE